MDGGCLGWTSSLNLGGPREASTRLLDRPTTRSAHRQSSHPHPSSSSTTSHEMRLPVQSLVCLVGLGASAVQASKDVFTPHDLVNLERVSGSLPSPDGAHLLSSVSRNGKGSTLYLTSLDDSHTSTKPLAVTEGASSFVWLSSTSLAYVKDGALHQVTVSDQRSSHHLLTLSSPTTLVTFPTSVGDLKYHHDSNTLAFTADVWPDGDLSTVTEQDRMYADRGNEGLVYDSLFVRHWDSESGRLFGVAIPRIS